MASQNLIYKFVPGSYSVLSSKGTSDHHIVKVEIVKLHASAQENVTKKQKTKEKDVKITKRCSSSKGIWKT